MFKPLTITRHRSSGRHGRRFAASIAALALAAVVSSPAAAVPLRQDGPSGTHLLVDRSRSDGATPYAAKLRTTAGYQVLVYQ